MAEHPDPPASENQPAAPRRDVTVFGGTGFLGRRVVAQLLRLGAPVRIAARHPDAERQRYPASAEVAFVEADIVDRTSIDGAVANAAAVVNCVALYTERRGLSFEDVHVGGARSLAEASAAAGVGRLVLVSGIGADPAARDAYIRSRGRGEDAVREAFPDAIIVRPSAMFSAAGAFFQPIRTILGRLPVVPLFGRGETRLQPVNVEDVAEAISHLATGAAGNFGIYEFGGPNIYTFRQLVERLAEKERRRPLLLPVPFAAWRAIAAAGRLLPAAPVTPAQVALMEKDNVVGTGVGTFADLGLTPRSAESLGLI